MQPSTPIRIDRFVTQDGCWRGRASGAVHGAVTVRLQSLVAAPEGWQLELECILEAGPQSFTARLAGFADAHGSRARARGRVLHGWRDGHLVELRAHPGAAGDLAITLDVEA